MRRLVCVYLFCLSFTCYSTELESTHFLSNVTSDFGVDDTIGRQAERASEGESGEFLEFVDEEYIERQQQQQSYLNAFDLRRDALLKLWQLPLQTTAAQQVIYSSDLLSRLIINPATQTVSIDIINKEDIPSLERPWLKNIRDQEISGFLQRYDLLTVITRAKQAHVPPRPKESVRTILEDELVLQTERMLSDVERDLILSESDKTKEKQKIQRFYAKRRAKLLQQLASSSDSVYPLVIRLTLPLPISYWQKKLQLYLDNFRLQASLTETDLTLLIAIARVSSRFDADARYASSSFGLMQVSASSAGIAVSQRVFRRALTPSQEILISPGTNIFYGANYLAILKNQYFAGVTEGAGLTYCMLAAYRLGPEFVIDIFRQNDNESLSSVVANIKKLSDKEIVDQLKQGIPYQAVIDFIENTSVLASEYARSGYFLTQKDLSIPDNG
ncbi:transglycosylase SLT domain-containing protein [Veronia pacifica]|uniref:Transglycosylase SLT domain-containing protein n=1 Tax=Veronia pacifica TaxID=1080227 RepID=A0A1C3EKT9_9GAMM|nr:transglycosylase SLT domain-containing protein [Veronia pacifica]ODA33847.1 hypothetical protein A8L45_08445 [Veronia pacifica]